MVTASQEDIEFEEAWAMYVRLQSDHVLWRKIKERERFENDLRLRVGAMRKAEKAEGEAKKARETAQNMKRKGLDLALIAEMTGLSPAEIERLG